MRGIARFDRTKMVDTSTRFETAFDGNNVRGACTTDGKQIWASGNGSSGTGGVWTIPFGTVGGGVQVLDNPGNVRFCHVFLKQLYATSGSGTFTNVFTVGSGTPTTSGQTATSLAGLPTSSANPYSFVIFDTDSDGNPDLLYIADERNAPNGGIYKWISKDGGLTWIPGSPGLIPLGNFGARGLTGVLQGTQVTLIATDTSPTNFTWKYVEDIGAGPLAPPTQILKAMASSTVFRGVAMGPR